MSNSYGNGTGPYGTAGRLGITDAIMRNKYPPPQQFPQQTAAPLGGVPGTPPIAQATPGAQALGQSPMGAQPISPMAMATGQPRPMGAPISPMAMATGQPQPMPGLGVPLPTPPFPTEQY